MIKKQLLVLSGKGGTGKTTIAAAFIELSHSRAFADCDVDAPNLHLTMHMHDPAIEKFYGLGKAVIDPDLCIHCGRCEEHCKFEAIKNCMIGTFECEGCGVCVEICPTNAIHMEEYTSGDLVLYRNNNRIFSTAQLKMGSGASGKLVTAVKKQLLNENPDTHLSIIDGSPGIGCPVIASISGVDMVLLVTEPSLSGIHDMKRILDTVKQFGVPCTACINKFDVNPDISSDIEDYCEFVGVPVIGSIPYDNTVVKAVNQCLCITAYPESPAAKAIALIWDNLNQIFHGGANAG